MKKQNPACQCKRISCPNHGDCVACRAKHHKPGAKYKTDCERRKARAQWSRRKEKADG